MATDASPALFRGLSRIGFSLLQQKAIPQELKPGKEAP
jgi:hypothetical protein